VEQIKKIQRDARVNGKVERPRWPMIVLNSPKATRKNKRIELLRVKARASN
jgi:xylulose-5-phosphate/fructose-6-phosphate phosphoketolase